MPNAMLRRRRPQARRLVPAWLARAWRPIRACTVRTLRCALCAALVTVLPIATLADVATGDAANVAAGDHVGPYAAGDFGIATGRAAGIQPAAAWYFADEYIATPRAGIAVTSMTPGMRAIDDVARAARGHVAPGWPAMVWVGSTHLLRDARMTPDGTVVAAGDTTLRLTLAPRLALNRSYFDASSARFAAARPLTLRGERDGDAFVLRSLWPQDFAVDASLAPAPLPAADSPQLAIRALMRATPDGGAREPFAATMVHRREGTPRSFDGKPALVVMVNGAQGDDDEAWGGHFAIGTGVIGAGGAIGDILVDNFYSLDVVSEKGILAAPTPLDRYLGDLNSGQGWYRPSFLAVVVLDDARAAREVQDAFNRMYLQFWRHQLVYQHATMNCAGISVDTLRALGLPVPRRGATSYVEAWLGVPYALAKYRSLAQARMAYEYLTEDVTRLLPAAAFEDTLAVLLRLAHDGAREGDGALARQLATDIVAIELLRMPQWPSSRRFGSWPVVTPDEYFGKIPHDPADVETVPVPPREFPAALRDPDLLRPPARRSDVPLFAWAGVVAIALGYALRFMRRRR
jgi:hypothetical protein